MKIQILVDNPNSWYIPYAQTLINELSNVHDCKLIHNHKEIEKGDIICILACEKIVKNLFLNKRNLVVHESDLPMGKGWSPVTWQVLEGINRIPVTLFEASEDIDSGVVYDQEFINLNGHELISEIKHQQGEITNKLILKFIKNYPHNNSRPQSGKESFYKKRTSQDSMLDMSKTIDEQFNLLRVVDNERYPAFFIKNGVKYILKIYKEDE